ncbi:hypothetical protein PV325_009410 [Microctonus aethiopoides]|nr:hypothetical protein PV325_009410 [Microctonus aethiopoides]
MVEPVEVKNEGVKKIYLGGWRHAVTKVIYHNAETQTGPLVKSNVKNICSRAVQCIDSSDDACQTRVHVATQMWRMNCYIPNECDKYLTIKNIIPIDEKKIELELNNKVKIIQKAYRSWRIIKMIKECAKVYRKMIDDCQKFEEEKLQRDEKLNQLSIIRQTFPQSRSDFAMIYGLIDIWWKTQLEDVKNKKNLDVDTGRVENRRILMEHITMLRNVEKHRQYIVEEYKKKTLLKFLSFHCKSVMWNGYKDKTIEMVTLRVQKARELKTLYDNLCCNDCTVEERIEMLILLKNIIIVHSCYPAIDLLHLIDQEIALLSSGIKAMSLNYLRERISLAFLYFIRQSDNCCTKNENSLEMELAEPIDKDKLLCRSCKRLLSRSKFSMHARMKKLTKCQACGWLQQQSVERVNYDPYTYLLNGIRAEEKRQKFYSNLLYVIQESDIYYLVKIIWHGRSIMDLVSEIVNQCEEKVYLGGWKNIMTSMEYYDAATQTQTHLLHCNNSCVKRKIILAVNRVTQTSSTKASKYTSIIYDKFTQTTCIPDVNDKLMTPSSASRNRLTSESSRIKAKELFNTRKFSRLEEESAIKIQRFLRACRAQSEISSLARFSIVTKTQPPIMSKPIKLNRDKRFEILKHCPPCSRADFEMLQNVLDRWRILENERIDRMLFGSSRMAAKSMILLREIELLRSIELAKSRLRNKRQERNNLDYLDKLAKLETWR